MAKSMRPNADVGLKACTQADIDYEARKVKVVLNYQDAYAQELGLATPLYEMYERGHPVGRADPRLGWFPLDEFDLMASGHWADPDPEYTGGRSTIAPPLSVSCLDNPFVSWLGLTMFIVRLHGPIRHEHSVQVQVPKR
jgi:hypothetical protein